MDSPLQQYVVAKVQVRILISCFSRPVTFTGAYRDPQVHW